MSSPQNRVAVVTGASSGIGRQVALALATDGWQVIGTGRDPGRMAKVEAEIRAASSTGAGTMLRADLSLMAEAERLAQEIAGLTDHIDLLVNNAGGTTDSLTMTSEGLEQNFAGNHLGPFLLTRHLLPLLRAAAAGKPTGTVRILNTASDASEMVPGINLDDMQNLSNWSEGLAYCTGKLANVLFTRALADKLADDGIVSHAVHPGAVDTNFFSYGSEGMQERTKNIAKFTEAEGADTLIWLVDAREAADTSGAYWFQRQIREPNPVVLDTAVVDRFWDESEKLLARTGR